MKCPSCNLDRESMVSVGATILWGFITGTIGILSGFILGGWFN